MTARFSANKSRYHYTIDEPLRPGRHSEFFADGERLYEATGHGTDRRFYLLRSGLGEGTRSPALYDNPTHDETLFIGVKAIDTRLESTTTSNDDRRYRLTGSQLRRPDLLTVGTLGLAVDQVEDPRLALTIGPRGVVYAYRLEYSARHGEHTTRVTQTIRFHSVGSTTIPDPDWYPAARRALPAERTATIASDAEPGRDSKPAKPTKNRSAISGR